MVIYESQRQKTYLRICVPDEDLDQPAHSLSLIRIFTGRILDSLFVLRFYGPVNTMGS